MAFCDLVSISGSKTIRFRASFQQVAPSSFGRAGKDQVVGQAVWPAEVFFDSVPARETARRFRLPGRTGPPPKLRRVYQARQIRGFLGPRIRLNRFARRAVEPFSQSLIPAIATGQPGNPVLLRQGLAGETACPTSVRSTLRAPFSLAKCRNSRGRISSGPGQVGTCPTAAPRRTGLARSALE